MTYLDKLAAEIQRSISPDLLPQGNTRLLFRLYAVLALAKGRAVSAADVHNVWAAWVLEQDPAHPSVKPFEQLDVETQASDEPFAQAIRRVAERFGQHLA
ncbi:MAG TPA: hypothetical protein VGF54_11985 [Streptosporangiaceae bacterium]